MTDIEYIFVESKKEFIPVNDYRLIWGLLSKATCMEHLFYPECFLEDVEIAKRSDLVKEHDIHISSRLHRRIFFPDEIKGYAYVVTDEELLELEKIQDEFMEPELACRDYVSILGYENFFDEGLLFDISGKTGGKLLTYEDIHELMDKYMEDKISRNDFIAAIENAKSFLLSNFSIEKSEEIASWNNGEKFSLVEETLYKNGAGMYFLLGRSTSNEKHRNVEYDKYGNSKVIPGQSITPFNDDDVCEWLAEKCPEHPLLNH